MRVPHDTHAPRDDSADPAWYPDPRRPGALRYWNGRTWVEADATEGWYPDPRDRRQLRFWTGTTWGGVLDSPAPSGTVPQEPAPPRGRRPATLTAAAALGIGLLLGGVVVGLATTGDAPDDADVTAGAAGSPTPASGSDEPQDTSPGPNDPQPAVSDEADGTSTLITQVTSVLSSRAVELADGRQVRLLGLAPTPCNTNAGGKQLLRDAVASGTVTVRLVADPASGTIGGYVEVGDDDLGQLLIAAGLAEAAVGHPRAPAYAAAAARAASACPPG